MNYFKVIGFTFLMYIFLIMIIRIMGKREVGSLSIFDLAVYFTISDLITIGIVDHSVPLLYSIISVSSLCFLQVLLSFITLKNKKVRDFLDGKLSIIIHEGTIDFEEMKKQRYSLDDLFTQIREKGFDSIENIRWAILENSGKLSIISKDNAKLDYPSPLIIDGSIDYDSLKAIKKDDKWLLETIKQEKIQDIKDIRLCLYSTSKLFFIFKHFKGIK